MSHSDHSDLPKIPISQLKVPSKRSWLDRVRDIHAYHIAELRNSDKWRVQDTAAALGYSLGSVSEALLVASWLKTHENQIARFKYQQDALVFIRQKKRELKMS